MAEEFEFIKSPQNSVIKEIRAAWRKGGLTEGGLLPIEGPTMIREAFKSNAHIEALLAADFSLLDANLMNWLREEGTRVCQAPPRLIASLSETEASTGVIALARLRHCELKSVWDNPRVLVLALAGLQDPGNLGAIIRSAEAFAVDVIFTTKKTVSAYNPKAVRASAGSILRVPIFQGVDEPALFRMFEEHGVTAVAASLQARQTIEQHTLRLPLALFIGQEARGLNKETVARCRQQIRIPMVESVQSLNAAIAAAILLYEIRKNEKTG